MGFAESISVFLLSAEIQKHTIFNVSGLEIKVLWGLNFI